MPTFQVRVYYTYYDEYQVEAADAEDAEAQVTAYRDETDTPTCLRTDDHVGEEVYDIMTEELDEGGEIIHESHTDRR